MPPGRRWPGWRRPARCSALRRRWCVTSTTTRARGPTSGRRRSSTGSCCMTCSSNGTPVRATVFRSAAGASGRHLPRSAATGLRALGRTARGPVMSASPERSWSTALSISTADVRSRCGSCRHAGRIWSASRSSRNTTSTRSGGTTSARTARATASSSALSERHRVKVTAHEISLTQRHLWRSAREAIPVQRGLVVEVEQDGLAGFGEASAFMTDHYNSGLDRMHADLRRIAPLLI